MSTIISSFAPDDSKCDYVLNRLPMSNHSLEKESDAAVFLEGHLNTYHDDGFVGLIQTGLSDRIISTVPRWCT